MSKGAHYYDQNNILVYTLDCKKQNTYRSENTSTVVHVNFASHTIVLVQLTEIIVKFFYHISTNSKLGKNGPLLLDTIVLLYIFRQVQRPGVAEIVGTDQNLRNT